MRKLMPFLLVMSLAMPAMALTKSDLDERLRKLAAKFEALQARSDKAIPAENLNKAKGIILLDRMKAGFIFAYQGGSGVAMVKDSKGQWGPPAFLKGTEASLGFQIGGQQSFLVVLMMSTNALRLLSESNFEVGGEARGTAGDKSAGEEGKVSNVEEPVLIYDDRKGLYGGASIKGGATSPDLEADRIYYGKALGTQDIVNDSKLPVTEAASDLARKVSGGGKAK